MKINQEALDKAIRQRIARLIVQINWHVRDIADELNVAELGVMKSGEAQAEIERQFLPTVIGMVEELEHRIYRADLDAQSEGSMVGMDDPVHEDYPGQHVPEPTRASTGNTWFITIHDFGPDGNSDDVQAFKTVADTPKAALERLPKRAVEYLTLPDGLIETRRVSVWVRR